MTSKEEIKKFGKDINEFETEMIQAVNRNAERRETLRQQFNHENTQKETISSNNSTVKEKYATVAKKSIKRGSTKKSTSKKTNRTVDPAKIAIISCALVSVLALGNISYLITGPQIEKIQVTREEINRSTDVLKTKAKLKLLYYNLAGLETKTNNIEIKNNTINDYRILNVSKPIDVYIYWTLLPSEEFDKFIQTVKYTEPYSDIQRECVDFNQFLRIHGYFYKDGELCIPSKEIFTNYMEEYIKNNYDELLEDYEYKSKNISYTFEQVIPKYEEPTRKGGR